MYPFNVNDDVDKSLWFDFTCQKPNIACNGTTLKEYINNGGKCYDFFVNNFFCNGLDAEEYLGSKKYLV